MTWFVKAHGLGNDYIVLDGREVTFALTPEVVRRICDRHYGVGSDGILLLMPSERADFGVRIFNPDGSEAEKSGNGLRILAYTLYRHGYTDRTEFTVETAGGLARARLDVRDGRVATIAVELGRATFDSEAIPVAGPRREVVDETLTLDGQVIRYTAVSVGNPHCVVPVDDLDAVPFDRWGPALEHHENFPNRTNVQFARVVAPDTVRIRIWERGAGHTLASGSSASATAAALHRLGQVGPHVRVEMEGGVLEVRIAADWTITLIGPVEEICSGQLSDDLLRQL